MVPAEFDHQPFPVRVVFGEGRAHEIGAEAERLGLKRILLLCTPGQEALARSVAAPLGDRIAAVFPGARMHVPVESVVAAETLLSGVDGLLAVGGGSTTGLAKGLALRNQLPILAVPTTYAGSEMTPVWGLTDQGVKRTGRDPAVVARCVLYDPLLSHELPVAVSVSSGLNAVAHAAEALYARDASPVVSLMAEEGARAMLAALPRLHATPGDRNARASALYAAWLCGSVLGVTTMSLHHKLCHVLGGMLDLPHAATHTVVLPHVLAFNLPAAPEATAALARATGDSAPARAIASLARRLGAPTSLAELGMREEDIPLVVHEVLARPYVNPRPVTESAVLDVVRSAWTGSVRP
ncbi:maleylacetate reductase [Amycolatopsis acidicola]|uniref:Maleylacetate reductase n=1 Tax=Amycolatopsis acidicola TaxID=2596893 RepID=A0A5N0V6C3_9PSEU|nr:maleylacetate reductase [Amycolatopsis acidicola]KAA9160713.1 maleylacetate reductase [Amycolatopsis acidicola]